MNWLVVFEALQEAVFLHNNMLTETKEVDYAAFSRNLETTNKKFILQIRIYICYFAHLNTCPLLHFPFLFYPVNMFETRITSVKSQVYVGT